MARPMPPAASRDEHRFFRNHGEYEGDVEGPLAWLSERFAGVTGSTHFLGNCLIDFTGPDRAQVETYFISSRLCPAAAEAVRRQSWGRYQDRFERRSGKWRIARRTVVIDDAYRFVAVP